MAKEPTPAERIQHASVVDQFLKNPVIDGAFKSVAVVYYEEFRSATDSDGRMRAWAKANCLEDLMVDLRAVVSSGEREVIAQHAKDKRVTPPAPRT